MLIEAFVFIFASPCILVYSTRLVCVSGCFYINPSYHVIKPVFCDSWIIMFVSSLQCQQWNYGHTIGIIIFQSGPNPLIIPGDRSGTGTRINSVLIAMLPNVHTMRNCWGWDCAHGTVNLRARADCNIFFIIGVRSDSEIVHTESSYIKSEVEVAIGGYEAANRRSIRWTFRRPCGIQAHHDASSSAVPGHP